MKKILAWFSLIFVTTVLHAQGGSNSIGTQMWPANPYVGIGTELSGGAQNALHIHYDTSHLATKPAYIRLSNGTSTTSSVFGLLGLMQPQLDTQFSSLSKAQDLILHENKLGDLILTNYWPQGALTNQTGGYIRLATAGDTAAGNRPSDTTYWHPDYERVTVAPNGNVGIDIPPDTNGNIIPFDQFQLGGRWKATPGYPLPGPPLTMYGGNQYEGLTRTGGGSFPADWRYISFNYYENHATQASTRFAATSTSGISFADNDGGQLNFSCNPYSSTRGMTDFSHYVQMQLNGNIGLQLWSDERDSDQYHALFDVYRPGYHPSYYSWKNKYGLSFLHTPLYIGADTSNPFPDFTNLSGLRPTIGDDSTWMLVVNGAVLAKEIFVLDSSWADYVFDPEFKKLSLDEFGAYLAKNHHLPEIPSAEKIARSGLPLGKTEESITKQIEVMSLYIVELNDRNDELSKQNELLSKKFETLEKEVQALKDKKEK